MIWRGPRELHSFQVAGQCCWHREHTLRSTGFSKCFDAAVLHFLLCPHLPWICCRKSVECWEFHTVWICGWCSMMPLPSSSLLHISYKSLVLSTGCPLELPGSLTEYSGLYHIVTEQGLMGIEANTMARAFEERKKLLLRGPPTKREEATLKSVSSIQSLERDLRGFNTESSWTTDPFLLKVFHRSGSNRVLVLCFCCWE